MLKKLPVYVATTVVVLAVLSVYGWGVREVVQGRSKLPSGLTKTIKDFVGWPDLLEQAKEEIETLPKTFVKTPKGFQPINTLKEDVVILTSYHNEKNKRTVALINLRTGEELKTWTVNRLANIHDRIVHTVMLEDSSLVYSLDWFSGFIRLDKNSERLWHQDSVVHHHGKNPGPDGTIWACTFDKEDGKGLYYRPTFKTGVNEFPFLDNHITQFDAYTGEILFHKSLTEILMENDLTYLLVKSDSPGDPIHVNDVEPVWSDGPYFKKGDLFISARNGSWIMQYRPSTGKAVKLIEGPFFSQHDVDVESDSTLVVFNNNTVQHRKGKPQKWPMSDTPFDVHTFSSQMVRIYLNEHKFEVVDQELWEKNNIFTFTEGTIDLLPGGGYFVEEQNSSVLWVIKDGEVIYKNVLPSHHEGYHHLANWARIMP